MPTFTDLFNEPVKTIGSFADLFGLKGNAEPRPLDTRQIPRPAEPYLRQQFPKTYGFLGGAMGTAPDQFEGSVLDPRSAQVRAGAEYGFPIGTALQVLPIAMGAKPLAQAGIRNAMIPSTLNKQAGVIKMPGGNWIDDSVENALRNLKSEVGPTLEQIQYVESRRGRVAAEEFRKNLLEQYAPDVAINNWVDKQLTRYVKNQMATPDDPVRALAERGVSHVPRDDLIEAGRWVPDEIGAARRKAGFPELGMVEDRVGMYGDMTPDQMAAGGWETLSDTSIGVGTARQHTRPLTESEIRRGFKSNLDANPWLAKVPPETPIYTPEGILKFDDLGFKHIVDELRNATNPASGLPRELLIKPESLQQLSMPQAVERVAKINKWRAEQKVKADLVMANNAATQTVKEYPEQGMKWVELRQPEITNLPEGLSFQKSPTGTTQVVDRFGTPLTTTGKDEAHALRLLSKERGYKSLEDALKYEGEQMRHCVGGYCPSVADGKTRIISLRDAKGEPHVTIELEAQRIQDFTAKTPDPSDPTRTLRDRIRIEKGEQGFEEYGGKLLQELGIEPPPRIAQIKGKANEKPNDKYLPFVQDYVKSGKWSSVDDLHNADLYSTKDVVTFMPENFTMSRNARQLAIGRAKAAGEMPEYMTKPEYEAMLLKHAPEDIWSAEKAKLAAEDDELLRQLRPPAGMAGAIPLSFTDLFKSPTEQPPQTEQMSERQRTSPIIGKFADLFGAAAKYGESAERTQQMQGVTKALGVQDIATTLDRASYGEPLTTGKGMTTKMKPETESAFLSLFGVVPMGKPAQSGAMAVGRAGEQLAERVVPNVMAKGGVGAEMLNAMASGSKSNVLPPAGRSKFGAFDPRFDPRVKEQARLNAMARDIQLNPNAQSGQAVSLVDFEGRPFITSMSDRTAAGGQLVGIDDVRFNRPVDLVGGQDYMFNNPGQVWASAQGPVKQLMKQAGEIKQATGQNPLYMPWRMAPTGGDFSSMTGEAMLSYADSAMSKKHKKALDKSIKRLIHDWAGVSDPASVAQFRNAPDKVRKSIKNMMDTRFRDEGGLNIGGARLSISDPMQLNAQEGGVMNVGEIFSGKQMIMDSGHPDYPRGVPGQGLGTLIEDLNVFQLMPEAARARGIPDPRKPRPTDIRALQMKPYSGIITNELLKSLGY